MTEYYINKLSFLDRDYSKHFLQIDMNNTVKIIYMILKY